MSVGAICVRSVQVASPEETVRAVASEPDNTPLQWNVNGDAVVIDVPILRAHLVIRINLE